MNKIKSLRNLGYDVIIPSILLSGFCYYEAFKYGFKDVSTTIALPVSELIAGPAGADILSFITSSGFIFGFFGTSMLLGAGLHYDAMKKYDNRSNLVSKLSS